MSTPRICLTVPLRAAMMTPYPVCRHSKGTPMTRFSRRTALQVIAASAAGGLSGAAFGQKQPAKDKPAVKDKAKPAKKSKAATPEVTFPPALPGGKSSVTDQVGRVSQAARHAAGGRRDRQDAADDRLRLFPGPGLRRQALVELGRQPRRRRQVLHGHRRPPGAGRQRAASSSTTPPKKSFRKLLDLKSLLNQPEGHYSPAKIHSRVDLGSDGWLYCSTHRGSPRVTNDKYHYKGDWIVRCHPETRQDRDRRSRPGAQALHPQQRARSRPADLLRRHGGRAKAARRRGAVLRLRLQEPQAALRRPGRPGPLHDLRPLDRPGLLRAGQGRVAADAVRSGDRQGPGRRSPAKSASAPPRRKRRRASSTPRRSGKARMRSDRLRLQHEDREDREPRPRRRRLAAVHRLDHAPIRPAAISTTSPAPTAAASATAPRSCSSTRKTQQAQGDRLPAPVLSGEVRLIPKGTYAVACDPAGDKLYITWNVSRGSRAWDCCGVTAIHIPESERPT